MEISSGKIGYVLFAGLCQELNSLTFEFWFVSCRYIQQYIMIEITGVCLTKTKENNL